MVIPTSKIFSSDTNMMYTLLVQILHPKIILSNKHIVLFQMVSIGVLLALVFLSPTSLLHFSMSYIFDILFLVVGKALF